METRFKLGDTQYPEENVEFFDGRYQAKMRNGNHSYHTEKIDPLSYKVASWREYGKWTKPLAKRAARHNAKLLMVKLTNEILLEIQMDLEDQLIDDDWYDDHPMNFDFKYSDDDYLDYSYDPHMDWDY